MRFFFAAALFCFLAVWLANADSTQTALSEAQQQFRIALENESQVLEKENTGALAAEGGWLFLSAEIRFLAAGKFWGSEAIKVSRARKPQWADPMPAIVDFHRQLKEHGIELLLVPVPPKCAVYPERIAGIDLHGADAAPFLHRFYGELRANGIEVLDLTPLFLKNRATEHGAVFCKVDSHWSGYGCVVAAEAISEKVRPMIGAPPSQTTYASAWKNIPIDGDLRELLGEHQQKPTPEEVSVRTVNDKAAGAGVTPDPNSPLLLLGDSHVLVFHDFLAERAGLLDQLALELGFAPDLIGTRGSGASPVRITLYRRGLNNPDYLGRKKVIVWCFAAREFTEAEQGWMIEPVAK